MWCIFFRTKIVLQFFFTLLKYFYRNVYSITDFEINKKRLTFSNIKNSKKIKNLKSLRNRLTNSWAAEPENLRRLFFSSTANNEDL